MTDTSEFVIRPSKERLQHVIIQRAGLVPELKGPWPAELLEAAVRELYQHYPSVQVIVMSDRLPDGCYPQHGHEFLDMLDAERCRCRVDAPRNPRCPVDHDRRTAETGAGDCKDCEQLIEERDRAQDALQNTHIALGGNGEWVGRLPPCPAPASGDLHMDVPELARLIKSERDAAFEQLGWCLGCNNSREACELQWTLQRKCCPDCTHTKPTAAKASEQHPRSLVEEAHTLGRQRPSKSHDAGSNPVGDTNAPDLCSGGFSEQQCVDNNCPCEQRDTLNGGASGG